MSNSNLVARLQPDSRPGLHAASVHGRAVSGTIIEEIEISRRPLDTGMVPRHLRIFHQADFIAIAGADPHGGVIDGEAAAGSPGLQPSRGMSHGRRREDLPQIRPLE